jgi:hypothetical protein
MMVTSVDWHAVVPSRWAIWLLTWIVAALH